LGWSRIKTTSSFEKSLVHCRKGLARLTYQPTSLSSEPQFSETGVKAAYTRDWIHEVQVERLQHAGAGGAVACWWRTRPAGMTWRRNFLNSEDARTLPGDCASSTESCAPSHEHRTPIRLAGGYANCETGRLIFFAFALLWLNDQTPAKKRSSNSEQTSIRSPRCCRGRRTPSFSPRARACFSLIFIGDIHLLCPACKRCLDVIFPKFSQPLTDLARPTTCGKTKCRPGHEF